MIRSNTAMAITAPMSGPRNPAREDQNKPQINHYVLSEHKSTKNRVVVYELM